MGKASKAKADRRAQSVAEAKKKAAGRSWLYPVLIVGIVVLAVVVVVVTSGKDDKGGKSGSKDDKTATAAKDPGNPKALIGKAAPSLSGPDMTGSGDVSLNDMAGKPTLVVFWAHWCPHCQKELPIIQKLSKQMKGQVNFLTVSTSAQPGSGGEQYSTPEKFIETVGMTMPTVTDSSGKDARAYGLEGFPQIYFLDSSLVVKSAMSGEKPEEVLKAELAQLT